MAGNRHKRTVATLRYPKHVLKPTDLLHFIYLDGFEDDCKELGLGEDDIEAMEVLIMVGGKDSPIIKGTGGLRKMRFAPETWDSGKSGAARICFVYFEEFWTVLMVTTYRKSEHDNLSAEAKRVYRKLIAEAERELQRRQTIR